MACFDAIIVILARPTMPCIHLVILHIVVSMCLSVNDFLVDSIILIGVVFQLIIWANILTRWQEGVDDG